jgi:hypothetical protein
MRRRVQASAAGDHVSGSCQDPPPNPCIYLTFTTSAAPLTLVRPTPIVVSSMASLFAGDFNPRMRPDPLIPQPPRPGLLWFSFMVLTCLRTSPGSPRPSGTLFSFSFPASSECRDKEGGQGEDLHGILLGLVFLFLPLAHPQRTPRSLCSPSWNLSPPPPRLPPGLNVWSSLIARGISLTISRSSTEFPSQRAFFCTGSLLLPPTLGGATLSSECPAQYALFHRLHP